jgi:hypothetical protein
MVVGCGVFAASLGGVFFVLGTFLAKRRSVAMCVAQTMPKDEAGEKIYCKILNGKELHSFNSFLWPEIKSPSATPFVRNSDALARMTGSLRATLRKTTTALEPWKV